MTVRFICLVLAKSLPILLVSLRNQLLGLTFIFLILIHLLFDVYFFYAAPILPAPILELFFCSLCWLTSCLPYSEDKEWQKKKAGHYTSVGGRFNKQGNSHMRHSLGGHKASRSPHLPAKILSVCRGLGSAAYSVLMVSMAHCSLKAESLKRLWQWEWWVEHTFQGQGRGWVASDRLGPVGRSTGSHDLSVTSSNILRSFLVSGLPCPHVL